MSSYVVKSPIFELKIGQIWQCSFVDCYFEDDYIVEYFLVVNITNHKIELFNLTVSDEHQYRSTITIERGNFRSIKNYITWIRII